MQKILVIDDEVGICSSLQFALEDKYIVKTTTEPLQGIEWAKEEKFHLCLLDLKIEDIDGIQVLMELKKLQKEMIVIIMTAYGSIASSVEAIKKGAYTYLTKPLHMEGLYTVIEQALEFQRMNKQIEYLSKELEEKYVYNGIIGKSPLMKNVYHLIDKLKDVDTNVMITGESGTGKELVARAIHYSGKRKKERFVVVNCAAIPESILESELFGYKKGTFTGAWEDKIGKFQFANHGTIFLDEIGDMPLPLQAKLLRVLQQKEVTPLGSNNPVQLNVRVIAATNKDLKSAVEEGTFRKDLYFRLNVMEIFLPPLRNKRQDLPLLFQHFIQIYNKSLDKDIKGLSEEAQACLLRYHYPGNIRELSNIIESAMIMAEGSHIQLYDLPEEVTKSYFGSIPANRDHIDYLVGLTIEEVEKRLIKATLKKNNGHRKMTARMLGISERGLRNKIARYQLDNHG